jgi:sodium pump decarboxylase gamma subunit
METLLYGLKVTVLGMGTVFIVLLLLILVINLISRFVNGNSSKDKTSGKEKTEHKVEIETIKTKSQDVQGDDELICVITAAVAASLNRSTHNLVVRSIRRVGNTSPIWNRTGRQEQIWTKL